MTLQDHAAELSTSGYSTISNIYSANEVASIITAIEQAERSNDNFRGTVGLFAIRQFLKEIPAVAPLLFNTRMKTLVNALGGPDYFVTKSIYFNKPGESNWFVAWHRDTTISVDKRLPIDGYGPWTVKHDQYAVQPPPHILAASFTLRIHLDDTDAGNGALKVIPGSHLHSKNAAEVGVEQICTVPAGGVMMMKPLLLHASGRTTNNHQRRVIHIEFCNQPLATPLQWAEYMKVE